MRKAHQIRTDMWGKDSDFQALTAHAKLVYLMLISQPTVNAVGLLPVNLVRWQRHASLNEPQLVIALRELEQEDFVWMDPETEELVIRSFIKHNVMGSPNLEKAAGELYEGVESMMLQAKIQQEYPDLFGTVMLPLWNGSDTLSEGNPETTRLEVRGKRSEVRGSEELVPRGLSNPGDVDLIWSEYQQHHPRCRLTDGRRRLILRRLRDYPVDTLLAAIRGNHEDPWCNGENRSGTQYHDLELILRDAAHVERYAGLTGGQRKNGAAATFELAQEMANREAEHATQ